MVSYFFITKAVGKNSEALNFHHQARLWLLALPEEHQSMSLQGLLNVAKLCQCSSLVPALRECESVEIWLRPLVAMLFM